MCELMLIQGETFFRHKAPIFQRLAYLKIRNTTLTLTICVVQLQHQNKKFTTINISVISCFKSKQHKQLDSVSLQLKGRQQKIDFAVFRSRKRGSKSLC